MAQNTLRTLYKNYKSYFRAIKDFKANPSKYKGIPKPPKYKSNLGILYFDYQSIKIKDQFIVINKEHKVHIPNSIYKDELKNFKTINFIPFYNKIQVVISYEVETTNKDLNLNEYLSIDLAFEEVKHHDNYKGSRLKRGLFLSSLGKVLNADINGALNILRKYLHSKEVNEFPVIQEIIDRGLLYRPNRITFC